jgi:hypothetical protein
MMLLNYTKEFFVKAAMQAKHMRMNELNKLETELIVTEDVLYRLSNSGLNKTYSNDLHNKISKIRLLIKEKKMKLI